jgi:hypothetical protein
VGIGLFPEAAIISPRTAHSAELGYGVMLPIRRRRRRLGSSVRPTARRSVCLFPVAAVFAFNPGRRETFPEGATRHLLRSPLAFARAAGFLTQAMRLSSDRTASTLAPTERAAVVKAFRPSVWQFVISDATDLGNPSVNSRICERRVLAV